MNTTRRNFIKSGVISASLADWIINNRDSLNIQYALHLGDLVNRGGRQMFQWDVASAAMRKLDAHVPYAISLGNHDYTDDSSRNRDTPLNDFFHPSNYSQWPTFGGVLDPGHLENSWHTFRAHDTDFLILALEFGPRDRVLDWANTIVEKHPHHRVILITHAYTYSDNRRFNFRDRADWQLWNPYLLGSEGGNNDGHDMWEKLVNKPESVCNGSPGTVYPRDVKGRIPSCKPPSLVCWCSNEWPNR